MNKTTPWLLLCATLLSACGGGGGGDTTTTQNKAPTVSVNGATVFETETVTLTATAADSDGSIAQYSWRQISGNAVALSSSNSASISFTAPTVTSDQTLTFQVTVTDDKGATKSATANVQVRFNQPPVIVINDGEVSENVEYTLSAAASDADGSIRSIQWRQIDGTVVTLNGANSSSLSFVAPAVEQDSTLRFEITATDNLGKTNQKVVSVVVKDVNQPPEVSVGSREVFESEPANLAAEASDADGSIAQYSWVQTGGTAVTFSGGTTANIAFTAPAVTADEILSFRVTVTDNKGASKTADANVTVKFNQLPVVTVANAELNEQTTGSIAASISDTDGSVASISWQQTAGPTVTLTGADTATIGFTTPDVQQDTELKFTVTATDNLGKSSSATSTATVKTTDVSYSIQGTVTDAPIANAVVTATIGSVTYTATANANGEYVLEIKLATDAGDELVILSATAPDSAAVLFHSILGNAEDIRSAAGNDTTLTNAELFATNVTNVTSAYYALVAQANNGAVPTTKAQLSQAALNVEGDLLLPFATAVKLVLDYSAGNADLALPAGFQTIAEWLANRDAMLEYINKAKLTAQASYDSAAMAIKADEKLVEQQFDSSTLTGRYYVARVLGGRGVAQFTLNADMTGEWLERDVGGTFNWSLESDGIVLDFGTPGVVISTNPIADFQYNATTTYLQKVTLINLGGTDASTPFIAESVQMSQADEAFNFEQIFSTKSESFTVFKQNAVSPALEHFEFNVEYALPYAGAASSFQSDAYIQADTYINVAKLRLIAESDTSGIAYLETADYNIPNDLVIQQANYPWQLNESGQIIITLSETDFVEISAFSAYASDDNTYVSVKTKIADSVRAISYQANAKRADLWNASTIPGIYLLPHDPLNPHEWFWLELYEDGTALTVSSYDVNDDGELALNEITQMPGYWQLDDNGNLHVRRYRKNMNGTGYCQAYQWQPLPADDCQLYNDRTMQLFSFGTEDANGEKDVSIIIDHRFYDSFFRGGDSGNEQLGYDLIGYGSYYNAIWRKVAARPIAID